MRKILTLTLAGTDMYARKTRQSTGRQDREYWVESMIRIVDPVYVNLSGNTLRKNMPVETWDGLNNGNSRKDVTHLEALGRSFCGITRLHAFRRSGSTAARGCSILRTRSVKVKGCHLAHA